MKALRMEIALGVGLAGLSAMAAADGDPWSLAGQFPQFRDMSGLPGGMFGVTAKGVPSIRGAMGISTPIGFSLGNMHFDLGAAARSRDNQPVFINSSTHGNGNSDGTGQLMGGFRTPVGNLTVAGELLSTHLDNVLNLQLQLPFRWERAGVSVGMQNVFNHAEAAADTVPGERELSQSHFIVGTYEVAPGAFVSVGKGDVRYRGVFGNACAMLTPRLKAVGEYDAFGWNGGLALSLGGLPNLDGIFEHNEVTLWAGFLQLHRACVALNFAF